MSELFNNVKVGDTVHYSTPQGQYGKGKVVIKHESGSHVVVNRGKGQPQVVNDKNYVKHERGGKVVGALLSKLAAHDKYLKGVAATKASNAVAKAVSPYKKVGDPQMNASKAFGWTKTNEMRNPSGPYGGDPHDWDPVLRKAIFDAAAKKVKKLPGAPQPSKLDTGRAYKPTYSPPPRRGTANEDASEAEGRGARVAKTKHKKKVKKLDEVSNTTLTNYVYKAIQDRKKSQIRARNAHLVHDPDRLGGADGERADYEFKTNKAKADKRSAGIKKAVAKIASHLPSEPLKAHADSEGSKHGGWSGMEARENEYNANIEMAASSKTKAAKGHYLMRDGRKLSGPHSPEDAVKQYKNMSDSKGVKIVHVKEGVMTDVTTLMLSEDKVKQAAQKAISLAKKAKSNKHVDTEPKLDIVDKGTHGPIQGDEEGGHNASV